MVDSGQQTGTDVLNALFMRFVVHTKESKDVHFLFFSHPFSHSPLLSPSCSPFLSISISVSISISLLLSLSLLLPVFLSIA